jgi:16S rRNA (adenine1518-N6/adenine1519-N6)-dimethyltransferase
LQRLLQLGFSAKRKMLRNNLKAHIENDRLLSSLATVGLEPNVRAEDLSLEQWILLSNYLVEMSNDVCNLSAKIPGVS